MGGMSQHETPNEGATNTWLTPPHIIEALGPFDLDPCAAPSPRPWPTAVRHIELPEDGLAAKWEGRVWCNPPYGPNVAAWMRKLADHGRGTALIFARVETAAWHREVWEKAHAILFLEGRLSFHRPDGARGSANAGAPSALVAYGPEDAQRLRDPKLAGAFILLRKEP